MTLSIKTLSIMTFIQHNDTRDLNDSDFESQKVEEMSETDEFV